MASLNIHRLCKTDKNCLANINTTEHHNHIVAPCFSLAFSLIPLSRFERINQKDRFRIKRSESNFPLTPIQMVKKYAEMSVVRKQHGFILVFMDPNIRGLEPPRMQSLSTHS